MSARDPMTIGDGMRIGCGMFLFNLLAILALCFMAALLGFQG